MAKHDLPANQWPELFGFLRQYIKSQEPLQREVSCMSVINIVLSSNLKIYKLQQLLWYYKLADFLLNNALRSMVLTIELNTSHDVVVLC